jgi:hypothetical protein
LIAAPVFELLPLDDVHPPYLAAPKEPRISEIALWEPDQGWLWDITLGGRVGFLRVTLPEMTFQIDLEGAAFVRLDLEENRNLLSSEFKYGTHFFFALPEIVFRFGYYHLSAHLGDEAYHAYPGRRPNGYSRDTFVAGVSFDPGSGFRIYAQLGFAPVVEGPAGRWEIELGAEWAMAAMDPIGRPFVAVHSHLREENDFTGNFAAQLGWHWRTRATGSTFRVGLHYYRGPSPQYQFYEIREQQIGFGSWVDF